MTPSHHHLIECNAFALKQGQTRHHVSIAAQKKFITHHDICLCKNTVSFTLTLARPDVAAIFYDFAKKVEGARFGQYSLLLIVVVRVPRLKYMQMHRASSPCLAILPLQPLSPFFFSTLRNHHCEQATAMMALCALTCFSISSVHCVFVTSSSSGLFSKSTVAI